MAKRFITPFAEAGDRAEISNEPIGSDVNMQTGYPAEYEADPVSDPNARFVERDKTNQLFNDITGNIKHWQENTYPEFITEANNGGNAFPYKEGAIVSYNDADYISLTDNNTTLPTSSDWIVYIPEKSQQALKLKIFQSPTDGLTKVTTFAGGVGVVYEVRKTSDNSLSTIYSDAKGTTEIVQNGTSNVSDSDGVVAFYIADGDYYVEAGGVKSNFKTKKLEPFKTVTEMRAYDLSGFTEGTRIEWQGYYSPSDGGGNWGIIKSGAHTDDGGSVFSIDDNTYISASVDTYCNVRQFGASSTLTAADNTLRIQRAITASNAVEITKDPAGNYKVSKSTKFGSEFPDNDQPCLVIYNKHNFKLYGSGTIEVESHGQSCVELQKSSDVVISMNIVGSTEFPPIDGSTGLSEKGTSAAGYNTNSIFQVYKNNSLDTSGYTGGGFGGAFPQYSGGTASTWGMWNDGFIGNAGFGILIHNDCHRVKVDKCNIVGFNFASIAVGFYGDHAPNNKNYPESTDITITNNNVTGPYDTGYSTMDCDGVIITGNSAKSVGHPDSSWSHSNVNPGYGYASRGNDFALAKNITVAGNMFKDCKRKGIDAHAGDSIVIADNIVNTSFYQGIFFAWSSVKQYGSRATITGNIIKNIKFDGIYMSAVDNDTYSYPNLRLDVVASGNVITDCDRAGIYLLSGRDVVVANNIIKHSNSGATTYGMYVGSMKSGHISYDLNITNNTIVAEPTSNMLLGLSVQRVRESIVSGNKVRNAGGGGLLLQTECTDNIVTGNMTRVGAGKTSCTVNQEGGLCYGNLDIGGEGINYTKNPARRVIAEKIVLFVSFNGTNSPSFTRRTGGDNVESVVSTASGFDINIRKIGAGTRLQSYTYDASSLAPSTGSVSCNYKYQLTSTSTTISIGLKEYGESPANISAESLTSGQLMIVIDVL